MQFGRDEDQGMRVEFGQHPGEQKSGFGHHLPSLQSSGLGLHLVSFNFLVLTIAHATGQGGFYLVGLAGLEPATFRPPDGRATRLRHSPNFTGYINTNVMSKAIFLQLQHN